MKPKIYKYASDQLEMPKAYSTYALDEEICRQSSSGGIFSVIANQILTNGGVVFGAVWDGADYVKHTKISIIEELPPLRKSKYLQSDIRLTFREAKQELNQGKQIFFVGTPCQIAGLRTFLKKDYKKLFTADLICMGVQSSVMFRRFLAEKEIEHKSKAIAYYRDKSKGWAPVVFTLDFENGQSQHFQYETNVYNHGFKARLFNRPSCDFCPFAKHPRTGDITLGDDWDYYNKYKNQPEKLQRGVSYISVNTVKGLNILKQIKPYCAPLKKARLGVGWQHQKNYARKAFWRYTKSHRVLESIEKYTTKKTLPFVILEKSNDLLNRIKRKIEQLNWTCIYKKLKNS
jgi:coenzyme F420-reducing hydrogenase beta subunit